MLQWRNTLKTEGNMANKIGTDNPDLLPNKGRGRPPGAVNKVTRDFRATVNALLEANSENVSKWLTQVAEGDAEKEIRADPGKALDLMAKLAEYAAPKLNRTEIAGDPDKPLKTVIGWEQ
jgi:hypothetical protein